MAATAAARPNVLLVTVDQWSAGVFGHAGHPVALTPTIDMLAANGVRYTNGYSECPVCVPARRTLMTGLTPAAHGCKDNAQKPFPAVTSLAQAFRDGGYQAYAVGKLHLQNQRERIGFDDVWLDEEGRAHEGVGQDDYEVFLGDMGHPGMRFAGGMNNNDYVWRPWHLPERLHVVNWAARSMAGMIKRRDRTRPGFWYLSFSPPHPPLHPLRAYLDMYRDVEPPAPYVGDWARDDERTPVRVRERIYEKWSPAPHELAGIRRAYYALCTHIDHQLRLVIGTLREEGLAHNTIILFTADHGDMLGNHNQWAKDQMQEDSHRVPLILCGKPVEAAQGHHRTDDRLCGLADVMPTLLECAGLPVPSHVEGLSLCGERRREWIYGEWGYGAKATRMVRDARHKLVYFPRGNQWLLFDMQADPRELCNLAGRPALREVQDRLRAWLVSALDADDRAAWVVDGELRGLPAGAPPARRPNYGFSGQRGWHWPPPPLGEVPWA